MPRGRTAKTRGGSPKSIPAIELVIRRARPNRTIAAAIREYLGLLNSRSSEETVRRFIATHLYFWNGLVRAGSNVYTKVYLASEYELDFAWCDPSSSGAVWHLAEIEGPATKLFTRAGEPSQRLSHAMTQVRDWQNWIVRHSEYADSLMPGVYQPMGHVFMGRRSELANPVARERLHAINVQQRAHLRVHTLDAFASMATSVLTWSPTAFPRRALGDRDLRRGLPENVLSYVGSPMGRSRDFLRERKHRQYVEDEDSEPITVPTSVAVTRIRQRNDRRA
jgi:hypothetical protein